MQTNKITDYRRIQNWENYFLCSAICSVGKALGSGIDDYHFYAAFTGDMFAPLYPEKVGNPNNVPPCDSGVSNSFFDPETVKKAFAAFGHECVYISNEDIKKDFRAAMNAIKASVDKGIPVVAWGMGNVHGKDYDGTLTEGCLIGGYGENDVLYVNLYLGQERLPEGSLDEYGYSTITNGLDTTLGLFIAGAKIENNDMRKLYEEAIAAIPSYLARPPSTGSWGDGTYIFGKAAFETWADTLTTESFFEGKTDEELGGVWWNLHGAPYCCICTSTAYDFLKNVVGQYPDLTLAAELLPLYKKMQDSRQEIWDFQGGFYPPMDKFRTPEFRRHIADILRRMGAICDEILAIYHD